MTRAARQQVATLTTALLQQLGRGIAKPIERDRSGGQAEELIDETDFAC
jgi:hypothetical protein